MPPRRVCHPLGSPPGLVSAIADVGAEARSFNERLPKCSSGSFYECGPQALRSRCGACYQASGSAPVRALAARQAPVSVG